MGIRTNQGNTLKISTPAEVIISHTNDSIRIGDGSDLVGTTTKGGETGLNIFPVDNINLPEIVNLSLPTANTEVSQAIPSDTKVFSVKIRGGLPLWRLSYTAGGTSTNYIEMNKGTVYKSPIADLGGQTVYVRTDKASQTAEFEFWKCV